MAMTAADLVVKMSADTKGAEAGIQRMSRGISGFAKQAAAVGTGILGAAAFAPIVQGFSGAITGAIGFGKEMANVNSILQTSSGTITKAGDDLLEMALRTAQAPTVLAAGLYQIVSSGYTDLADAEKILEISAKGATAGLTTTDVSARAVVGTMNAYGLGVEDAQRVSDVFFQTVNDGVLTYDQLANNLGKTTALAAGLNVPIEQLGAAYAQMTRNNVDAAQSETQIAALFRSALSPTQALTDAVHAHGYESAEALIKAKGLPGYLELLNETAGGSQTTMQDLVGTQEAANAAMILGQKHGKAYNEILNHMAHASDGAGATQKALNKQMESSAYAIQKAKVALQVLATAGFGIVAPLVTKLATGLSSFVIKDLIPFTKIIGRATSANFTFGRGFDKLLKGIPQPLRRSVHALASFTDALSDMWRHGFSRNEITQAFHAVQALGEEFGQGVHWVVNAVVDAAISLGSLLIQGVIAAPGAIFDWVRGKLFGKNTGISQDPASPMFNQGGAPIDAGVWDVAVALGKLILNGAEGVISDIAGWVTSKITGGGGSISQDPASPMYGQQGMQVDLGTAILSAAAVIGGELLTVSHDVIGWLKAKLNWPTDGTFPVGDVTLQGNVTMQNAAGETPDKQGDNWVTNFLDGVYADAQKLHTAGLWITDQVFYGLGAGFGAVVLGVGAIGKSIIDALIVGIEDPTKITTLTTWISEQIIGGLTRAAEIPVTIFSAFWSGVIDTVTAAAPQVQDWADAASSAVSSLMSAISGAFSGGGASQDPASPMYGGGGGGFHIPISAIVDVSLQAVGIKLPDGGILPDGLNGLGSWIQNQISESVSASGMDQGISAQADAILNIDGWNDSYNIIFADVSAINGTTATAKADLNINPFEDGYDTIMKPRGLGDVLRGSTFTAKLDGDNGPFAVAYTAAFGWGDTFAAQDFQATLSADTGPAAIAYTNAFGWGATWAAQTFTARFAIDTSGLWNALAVAQTVAAGIAAVMPHSLAKKGPLSKPIRFNFIEDAARHDLLGLGDRIAGWIGVGGNRRPLAYAGVHAGPRTVNITIHEAKNAKETAHEVHRELKARGIL
jgi:TP901 family phage tail tape measure protein